MISNLNENTYFCWLCNTFIGEEYFSSHYRLLSAIFDCDFVSIVENDCNREVDGKALRSEFEALHPDFEGQLDICLGKCRVLELIIGLAKHMVFFGGHDTGYWVEEMLTNLGFSNTTMSDDVYDLYGGDNFVYDVIDYFVNRRYCPDGVAGLFPLENPTADQREVELWYQMQAYIIEKM